MLSLVLALMPLAFADTPRKDPEVAALRERFRRARAPRLDELSMGKDWACRYSAAFPGSHEHSSLPDYFTFQATTSSCTVTNQNSPLSPSFQLTATALVGANVANGKAFGADRVRLEESSGRLLVEYTLPRCRGLECVIELIYGVRSLDDGRASVVGYRECVVAK